MSLMFSPRDHQFWGLHRRFEGSTVAWSGSSGGENGLAAPGSGKGAFEVSLDQKRARVFGVFYLLTFVTSIWALVLYETVLRHPVGYIASGGHDTQILFAALLELILIITNIGTAGGVFPLVRRQKEGAGRGDVAARPVGSPLLAV